MQRDATENTAFGITDEESESFATLSDSEREKLRAQLLKREQIISRSLKSWQAGATALAEIRDLRLHRAAGYTDFGLYCRERLAMGKSTVNRLIAIGEVCNVLASVGATLPTSERQVRPLLALRQPEQERAIWGKKVTQVWAKALDDARISRTPITEKKVLAARKQLGFDPPSKEEPPKFDLEMCWAHLQAQLEHVRELCPVDERRELCVRAVGVICGWQRTTKTYSTRKEMVGTVRKSTETICPT